MVDVPQSLKVKEPDIVSLITADHEQNLLLFCAYLLVAQAYKASGCGRSLI
jgi:hypothetical protein